MQLILWNGQFSAIISKKHGEMSIEKKKFKWTENCQKHFILRKSYWLCHQSYESQQQMIILESNTSKKRFLVYHIRGLANSWKHLYFEVLGDHKTIKNFWKGKKELTTHNTDSMMLKLCDST